MIDTVAHEANVQRDTWARLDGGNGLASHSFQDLEGGRAVFGQVDTFVESGEIFPPLKNSFCSRVILPPTRDSQLKRLFSHIRPIPGEYYRDPKCQQKAAALEPRRTRFDIRLPESTTAGAVLV